MTLNGKVGFIDRTGNFAIAPIFDKAWWFKPGLGRTSAERDGTFGVIDKTGAWVFETNYQQVHFASAFGRNPTTETVFGWHFKKADRWGLLDLDGRVVLDADFDQTIQHCADGRLVAYKNKEWLYFKNDGSPLQPPDGRLIDASCGGVPPYTLKIGDKFGLVDANSNPVTPVHFDAIVWAAPSVKNVKIDGKWGRIGLDGRWLSSPNSITSQSAWMSSLPRSTASAASCDRTGLGSSSRNSTPRDVETTIPHLSRPPARPASCG